MEMTDVDRNVLDANVAQIDRVQIAIDDFEPAAATNPARQAAARHRLDANLARGFLRDHGHARASVQHKPQRLLRAVNAHVDDGAVVEGLERQNGALAAYGIERTLRAEIPQEIDEAANPSAPVRIRTRRDDQKTFIGVGGFARRGLAQTENIVRLVAVDRDGAAKFYQRVSRAILIKINHRQTGNRHRFVRIQCERRAKLFDRKTKIAGSQNRGAQQRVRPRRQRIDGHDPRGVIERILQAAQFQERLAQTQPRFVVPIVLLQYLAVKEFGPFEISRTQGLAGFVERLLAVGESIGGHQREDQQHRDADQNVTPEAPVWFDD